MLYKKHNLVYYLQQPRKKLWSHTVWHPGTTTCLTLAQSLNQLFSKNFQPPWEAALPDCDTKQQRDWFAQKRREIDLIEQEIEIRRMEIKLQEQQLKEQQMRERLQDARRHHHRAQQQHSIACGHRGTAHAQAAAAPSRPCRTRKRPCTDACAPSSAPAAAVEHAAQHITKPIKHFDDFQIGSDEHLNYLGIYT